MKIADITEPPLRFIFLSSKFFRAIFRRLSVYLLSLLGLFVQIWAFFKCKVNYLKKISVRILMYRGGYFYPTHRLGLAAITSTTVFSMFFVPMFSPVQTISSMPLVLADDNNQEEFVTESFAFANSVNPAVSVSGATALRNQVDEYTVQSGDTISTIAEKYLVSVEALKYVNNLDNSDLIHPGDNLEIPPVGGLIHTVESDETISTIASTYSVSAQAIVDFNHIEEPYVIHKGDDLVIPDAQVPVRRAQTPVVLAAAQKPSAPVGLALETITTPQTGTGGFIMPTSGVISQYFWWGHTAIDLAAGCGTPIVAADSGTITFSGWWAGGGGNSIFVDHGNGYVTKYAHMSGFERTSGSVQRGEIIGYMGATGRAYGCHLHFIVTRGGVPIDPISVL